MSRLADRLRGIVGGTGGDGGPDVGRTWSGPPHDEAAHDDAAELLGGVWHEARGDRFLVVDRTYLPGHRHGHAVLADGLPPPSGVWPRLPLLGAGSTGGRLLFVDLETTGLAGGAGTYAFLVGCGWFDGGVFRVRQFVLSSFTAERALLEALAADAGAAAGVATFNGKSFDLPLLETRFALHRLTTPFAGLPHVDLLHPARRLWRDPASLEDCRLTTLEQALCGYAREGDVPGFEIPGRYFHFVRTGEARALAPVLEHNRLDLVSLALLTARAAQLLDDGPAAARTGREALGLGRIYERGGLLVEARRAYERAAEVSAHEPALCAEALRAAAVLLRRERRHHDAAAAWRRLLALAGCPARLVREATEALAVHHEHRLRDPDAARQFALRSMQSAHDSPTRQQALRHRLARLDRKMGAAQAAAPLF